MSPPGLPLQTSPFWDFSLTLYRRAAVRAACLAIQDEAGADVNIALFVLWQASRGHALDAAEVAALDALVAPWRSEVVVRLRAVRRFLKPIESGAPDDDVAALRREIKTVELESERLQQELLHRDAAAWGSAAPAGPELGARHLALYAAHLGHDFPAAAADALVAAAFA